VAAPASVPTDHWVHSLFQSTPDDLIALLLQAAGAAGAAAPRLGPARLPRQLQLVMDEVIWISSEELGQQQELDPLLNLLTLPVRRKAELHENSQRILKRRPDLAPTFLPTLVQRPPTFSLEQIMVYVNIPTRCATPARPRS
jgi:hypothetical protein